MRWVDLLSRDLAEIPIWQELIQDRDMRRLHDQMSISYILWHTMHACSSSACSIPLPINSIIILLQEGVVGKVWPPVATDDRHVIWSSYICWTGLCNEVAYSYMSIYYTYIHSVDVHYASKQPAQPNMSCCSKTALNQGGYTLRHNRTLLIIAEFIKHHRADASVYCDLRGFRATDNLPSTIPPEILPNLCPA